MYGFRNWTGLLKLLLLALMAVTIVAIPTPSRAAEAAEYENFLAGVRGFSGYEAVQEQRGDGYVTIVRLRGEDGEYLEAESPTTLENPAFPTVVTVPAGCQSFFGGIGNMANSSGSDASDASTGDSGGGGGGDSRFEGVEDRDDCDSFRDAMFDYIDGQERSAKAIGGSAGIMVSSLLFVIYPPAGEGGPIAILWSIFKGKGLPAIVSGGVIYTGSMTFYDLLGFATFDEMRDMVREWWADCIEHVSGSPPGGGPGNPGGPDDPEGPEIPDDPDSVPCMSCTAGYWETSLESSAEMVSCNEMVVTGTETTGNFICTEWGASWGSDANGDGFCD